MMNTKRHLSEKHCIVPQASEKSHFCAEVVESSLHACVVQAWEWNRFPSFGSIVFIPADPHVIIGMIASIQTGSIDPSRYPIAYQKTEQELAREQPQIFEFLHTMLHVKILGYVEVDSQSIARNVCYTLPPQPPKIHHFVGCASKRLINLFLSRPDYLYLLFSRQSSIDCIDDLLISIVQTLKSNGMVSDDIMQDLFAHLAIILGSDYRFIKRFINRITPFIGL